MRRKTYNRGHRLGGGGSCWSGSSCFISWFHWHWSLCRDPVHNTKDFARRGRICRCRWSPQRSSPPGLVRRLFWCLVHLRPGGSRRRGSGPLRLVDARSSLVSSSPALYKLNIITWATSTGCATTAPSRSSPPCIVASYLGWVSAQIKALGLILNVVTNDGLSQTAG